MRLSPIGTSANIWPIVPAPDDRWWWVWGSRWNENWQGKPKYSEKTCPSATFSTTNPTWPDLTRDRTRAAAMGSRRLTAWAMARPICKQMVWMDLAIVCADFLVFQVLRKSNSCQLSFSQSSNSPPFMPPDGSYCVQKSPPFHPMLSRINPVYILAPYTFEIHFNVIPLLPLAIAISSKSLL
jgi:hypothetical protein